MIALSSRLSAQVITPSSPQYQAAKLSGQLSQYTVIPAASTGQLSQSYSWHESPSRANPNCDCMQNLDSTFMVVPFNGALAPEFRNDDLSSAAIALPFTFCLYGQSFDSVYINNNGNLSFHYPMFNFTSDSFPSNNYTMTAPYWADIDTRDSASGLVYYKISATHMIVRWDQVGYFPMNASRKNDFQIIITDGNDPLLPPGINVGYCYGQMEWASGAPITWGTPATVGANEGDGTSFIQFGRFGDSTSVYDGPYGNPDGIQWLSDQQFYFNSCTDTTAPNVEPIIVSNQCDTVLLFPGDTVQYNMMILAGDPNQNSWANFSMGTFNDFTVTPLNTQGHRMYLIGVNTTATLNSNLSLVVEAFDDGSPAAQFSRTYELIVNPLVTGIGTDNRQNSKVFPNPVNDVLNISGVSGNSTLQLTDLSGKLVLQKIQSGSENISLDVSALNKGIFLLSIISDQAVQKHKIIIQ